MPIPFESRGWAEPFFNRAVWVYKFAWWPKRCYRSEQWIWLTHAYRGVAVWYGPGEPAIETEWLTKMEFIRASLS